MLNRRRGSKPFFVMSLAFSVLAGAPSSGYAADPLCEGLFSAAKDNSLLAPKTIAGRMVRDRLVRGILNKTSPATRSNRPSTSISSSGAGEGLVSRVDNSKKSSSLQNEIQEIRKRSFRAPIVRAAARMEWVSDRNLIFVDKDVANSSMSIGAEFGATILNGDTGALHHGVLVARKGSQDAMRLPVLVIGEQNSDRHNFTYRFLDKTTLQDVRPPLTGVTDVSVLGNFISYQQDSKLYLTSLRADGFGRGGTEYEVRKISPVVQNQFYPPHLTKIWDAKADNISVYLDVGIKRFQHIGSLGYAAVRLNFTHSSDVIGGNGKRHTVQVDRIPGLWEIRTQGEKGVQKLESQDLNDESAEIRNIFGDGSERSVIIEAEGRYQLVTIGFNSSTKVDGRDLFSHLTKQGDRFLTLRGFFIGVLSEAVIAIDLVSGRKYDLAATHTGLTAIYKTQLLDSKHYINVDTPGTVRIHDLETGRLVRQLAYKADIDLVEGTRVLKVTGFDGKVDFIDLQTEQVLWSGSKDSNPTVSPDGSRVAYIDGDKVSIMILGDRLVSRRTF